MWIRTIRDFARDDRGGIAMEYALLGVLIAMSIVATAAVIGNSVVDLFNNGSAEVLATQTGRIR